VLSVKTVVICLWNTCCVWPESTGLVICFVVEIHTDVRSCNDTPTNYCTILFLFSLSYKCVNDC